MKHRNRLTPIIADRVPGRVLSVASSGAGDRGANGNRDRRHRDGDRQLSVFAPFRRRPFYLRQDSNHVFSQHFAYLGVAVAAIDQSLGDDGIGADVFQLPGNNRDAVKVRAKTDVIDTSKLDNMVNVIQYVVNAAQR